MKTLVLCLALVAAPALAGAPQPAKTVQAGVFSGRWYDIAHTPNPGQTDCQGATSDFFGWAGGAFHVVQTCHKGSPAGPERTFKARASIMPATGNAKLRMSFFGGLISQEYWILDHAEDNGWAIMATPGGHYVWLLSRRPVLDAPTRGRALDRVKGLGYDISRLAFPRQLAR
jgi:apolipoprotein D and lipocalin family protein